MPRTRRLTSAKIRAIWQEARGRLGRKPGHSVLAVNARTGRWVTGRDSRDALLKGLRRDPDGDFEVLRLGERPWFQMKYGTSC